MKSIVSAIVLAAASSAFAGVSSGPIASSSSAPIITSGDAPAAINYNFVEAGYVHTFLDDNSVFDDSNGYYVGGSYQFAPNFFVTGGLNQDWADSSLGLPDVRVDTLSFGLGGFVPLCEKSHLVGSVSGTWNQFSEPEVYLNNMDDDSFGVNARLGIRFLATANVELGAYGTYSFIDLDQGDDDSFGVLGQVIIHTGGPVSIVGSYGWNEEESQVVAAGLRLNF